MASNAVSTASAVPIYLRGIKEDSSDDSARRLVHSSWLKAAREGAWAREMGYPRLTARLSTQIRRVLAREDTEVLLACPEEYGAEVCGFAVFARRSAARSRHVVYWVWVRREFREIGIARTLIHAATRAEPFVYACPSHCSRYVAAHFAAELDLWAFFEAVPQELP